MRRFALLFAVPAVIFLNSCGGGRREPVKPDLSGHWSLTLLPTATQERPIALGGHLTVSNGSIQGTLHAFGTNCFPPETDIPFTSSAAGGATTMTSTEIDGQVVTMTMSGGEPFFGNYRVDGGCADGQQGSIVGFPVQGSLTGTYQAHFGGQDISGNAILTESATHDTHGVFPITGTLDMNGSLCSASGTIDSGFAAGLNVILHITTVEADGSTARVRFDGNAIRSTTTMPMISGTYTYESGACAGTSSTLALVK